MCRIPAPRRGVSANAAACPGAGSGTGSHYAGPEWGGGRVDASLPRDGRYCTLGQPDLAFPTMTDIGRSLQTAFESLQAGDLPQAEHACRRILERAPEQPDALHLLGVAALRAGNHEEAISLLERAVRTRTDSSEYHANLGAAYGAAGRHDAAAECLRRAIRFDLRNAQHHYGLGVTLRKLGRLDESAASYRSALAIDPTAAAVHDALGRVLKQQDQPQAAAESFRRAIEYQPGLASAHDNLGGVLMELGDFRQAVRCHREAVRLSPESASMRNNLAVALKSVGNYKAAEAEYSEALRLKPDDQDILFNLAAMFAQRGEFDQARRYSRRVLKLNPDFPKALALLNSLKDSPDDDEERQLLSIICSAGSSNEERIEAGFVLGSIYDRQGKFDDAFSHYAAANRLRLGETKYDESSQDDIFAAIRSVFSRQYFEESDVRGSDSVLPIFIVGMPRSGTTLVEQIISSHPRVHGAGELKHIKHIAQGLSNGAGGQARYPWNVSSLTNEKATSLANEYLAKLRQHSDDAIHITDKLPANFLYLGLIVTLFPRARIIHCKRHPIDVCLSCFFQSFREVDYSFDLAHLGRYYIRYAELMAHWRDVLPAQLLEVSYEELVEDQERVSRWLIDHCGLDWDERCLEFHKNDRSVNTASFYQVRRPMYSSSVNRWISYEKYLGSLKELLIDHLP